jgi:hypothetical protein
MHIKPKPFLLCWLVLGAPCFALLIVMFGRQPSRGNAVADLLAAMFISAIFGGATAFVICGLTEAARSVRAGKLSRSEVAASLGLLLLLALVLLIEGLLSTPIFEIILVGWLFLWLLGVVVRRIATTVRSRTGGSTLHR